METTTVDELDRQLVQCLAADGRASFGAIAEVLGVSGQTVARRYRRLRTAGLLRVVGLRYPGRTGTRTGSSGCALPRSGWMVDVTAYSRLHMFRGGPDWLGFMDVLPVIRTIKQASPVMVPRS